MLVQPGMYGLITGWAAHPRDHGAECDVCIALVDTGLHQHMLESHLLQGFQADAFAYCLTRGLRLIQRINVRRGKR